jgi:hypothetical protein
MIVVKEYLCSRIKSPKIIILSGSNGLYNIDAKKVEEELKIPCINFGLHAGMSLDWLLDIGRKIVQPGDVLILPLEQAYYENGGWNTLGGWRLRNALAWNLDSIQRLNITEKIVAYCSGGNLDLALDLITEKFQSFFSKGTPVAQIPRLEALESSSAIIDRFKRAQLEGKPYPFYQSIDDHGTVLQSDKSEFNGKFVPATSPGNICPATKALLRNFIDEIKNRGVHVYFAHSPYGIEGEPKGNWRKSELTFQNEIGQLGCEVIDKRESLFYPRKLFFDTALHMTSKGKELRTSLLINNMKKKLNEARSKDDIK